MGCCPIGFLTAAMTRHKRRFRSSTGPWRQTGSPAAARRYLRGFRSRDLNGSCRRRRETNLTVFDTRATAMVNAIPTQAKCPMFKMMDRRVSNGEPVAVITSWRTMTMTPVVVKRPNRHMYESVSPLARHGGRGFSCCFGVSGIVGSRFRQFGAVFHEMVS